MRLFCILAFTLLCGLFPGSALYGKEKSDWREELDPVVGVPWLPMPEGKAVYHFGWSGFKAAEAELTFSREGEMAQVEVKGRTVGAARLIFRLDTRSLLLANVATSRPVRTRLLEEYGDREVVSGLEFGEKAVVYGKSRREDEEKIPRDLLIRKELDRSGMRKLTGRKGKRFKFPGMIDMHSALLYLRAQELRPGEARRFVVFHGTAPYRVEIRAGKPGKLKTAAGEFSALPFTVALEWVDKKERLRKHKNFRSATGWFSDDPARLLLKVESEVFVGKIWAELVSFDPKGEGGVSLPVVP